VYLPKPSRKPPSQSPSYTSPCPDKAVQGGDRTTTKARKNNAERRTHDPYGLARAPVARSDDPPFVVAATGAICTVASTRALAAAPCLRVRGWSNHVLERVPMRGALSVAACAATPGADARHRSSWSLDATSAPRAVRRRASPPAQRPLGPGLCPSANGRWAQVQARPAPADPSGWAAVRHDVQRAVLGLTILAGQPPGGSQRLCLLDPKSGEGETRPPSTSPCTADW